LKKIGLCLLLLSMLLTASCSPKEKQSDYTVFPSADEALDYGLTQENATVLIEEKEEQGTLMLIQNSQGAISVAILSPVDQGFIWYRDCPYYQFESSAGTVNGVLSTRSLPVVFGKTDDSEAQSVVLKGEDGITHNLKASKGYFMGIHLPESTYTVTPDE